MSTERLVGVAALAAAGVLLAPATSIAHAADYNFRAVAGMVVGWDGNVYVVERTDGSTTETSDEVARLAVDLNLTARTPASTWTVTFRPTHEAHSERSEFDNTGYAVSLDQTHRVSERFNYSLTLTGARTERQGVREEAIDQPVTLVPRTRIDHARADVRFENRVGRRSSLRYGVAGALVRHAVVEGVTYNDSDSGRAAFGWQAEVSTRASVGVGCGYGRFKYTSGITNDSQSLFFTSSLKISEDATVSINAGAASSGDSLGATTTNMVLDASIQRRVGEHNALNAGARQGITPGTGLTGTTRDRGVYTSWNYAKPRGWNARILLGAWDSDDLGLAGGQESQRTRTLSTSEGIGWSFDGQVTLGLAHSYRQQKTSGPPPVGLDPAYSLDTEAYNDWGFFIRWVMAGR